MMYHQLTESFKIKIEFKNVHKLDEFLLSKTQRILSIETCDSKLELNRIFSIFKQLGPNCTNSGYLGAENVSVISWSQLNAKLKEGPDITLTNLTIIDASNHKTVDPEHRTTLRNLFDKVSRTNKKKIILVSALERICIECTDVKDKYDAKFVTKKKVYEISFRDLIDDTQKQLLKVSSIFFGKETITLKEFLRKNYFLNEESLNNIINSTVLHNMLYNKKNIPIRICNDQSNYFKDFYIERTFCNQYFVSKKIWKLLVSKIQVNDAWIFSGVKDQSELIDILKIPSWKISKLCENISFFEYFEEAKFFLENSSSCRPIHLLKYENAQFLWTHSKGCVDKLRKYIFKNPSSKSKLSELLSYKTVIINGPLGIGKSTTLQMLSTYPFWILQIKFSSFNDMVKNIPKIINRQTLITFLTNYIGTHFLVDGLLNFFLFHNSKIPIYLLFDGFDDIAENIDLDTYKSFLQLLVFIKENSNAFIWVSSKPENCIDLENNLSTFSTYFNDINKNKIQDIFHKNNLIENTQISLYYKNSKKLFNNKQKILGVPLLCAIISKFENLTIKLENIEELFFHFIESKIETYMSKNFSNSNYKTEIVNYIKAIHGLVASKPKLLCQELEHMFDKKDMTFHINITKVGFVVLRKNGNYEFTYKAVADYFVANMLYEWISAPSGRRVKNLLCTFLLENQYVLVRLFLNYFIQLEKPPAMPQNVEEHIVKSFHEDKEDFFDKNRQHVLQILIKEKLFNIIGWFFPKIILELIHPYLNKCNVLNNFGNDLLTIDSNFPFPNKYISHQTALNGLSDNLELSVDIAKIPVDIVDRNNVTPIQSAASDGRLDDVKFLKSRNANVNHKDNMSKTALIRGIEKKHIDIVKFLVEDIDTDKDCHDKNGISALEYGAISKNIDLIKYLSNTNVHHVDKFGMTALCWAVKVGDIAMTDYLIKIGCDLNIRDNHGSTLINIAMKSKRWHLIRYLTFCLVDVNMADFNGITPLERAIKSNQWNIVKYLILEGASLPNTFNPIKNAAEAKQWNLVKLMLEHQGNLKGISVEIGDHILNLFVDASFAELILLGNVDVINLFIRHGKFDDDNLDRLLSEPYETILFKNKTDLQMKMKIFVEEMLVTIRSRRGQKFKLSEKEIEERKNLVREEISSIENISEINKDFITRARIIAQNIELLKRSIRKSNIPWEQMEFCIVIFINFFLNPQQEDFVYRLVLDQDKLISYLKSFSISLFSNEDFSKMEDLEKDYRILKDIYSLNRISFYIKLASTVNDNTYKNKEIINSHVLMRCLQVIGESFKKTTDSPNLSPETHEFLILSAPTNVARIVTSLRDSLSHSDAYKQKLIIENKLKTEPEYFEAVNNDLKKILLQIDFLLFAKKRETLEIFRKKCSQNQSNLQNINRYINWQSHENKCIQEYEINDIKIIQEIFEKLKLANENSNKELDLIAKLSEEINSIEETIFKQLKDIRENYYNIRSEFRSLDEAQHSQSQSLPILTNDLCIKRKEGIYYNAVSILVDLINFYQNTLADNNNKKLELVQICSQLCYIMKWDAHKIKNIQEIHSSLSGKFEENSIQIVMNNIGNYLEKEEDVNLLKNHVEEKIQLHESFKKVRQNPTNAAIDQLNIIKKEKINLKKSLQNNKLQLFTEIISKLDDYGKLVKNYATEKFYKFLKAFFSSLKNKNIENAIGNLIEQETREFEKIARTKLSLSIQIIEENINSLNLTLQSAIEILLLDVMEACITKNAIIEYVISFDEFSPVLVGTALRNYLAHGTPLIDTLPFDPLNAILATVRLLKVNEDNLFEAVTEETLIENNCINNITKEDDVIIENINSIISNDDVQCFESIMEHRKMSLCKYFFEAASQGSINIIKYIIDSNNHIVPSILIWPAIILASKNGHENMIRLFLNLHKDTSHHANFESSSFDNIANMLSTNFDIQMTNNTKELTQQLIDKAFELAATNGHFTITKLLLKYNPDLNNINHENLSLVHLVAKNGHSEIIKLLLRHNANISSNSMTPLHLASIYGHSEAVKVLLKHKSIKIDAQLEHEGYTSLHLSAKYGCVDVTEILLEKGANIEAVTTRKLTALHLSALHNHVKVATVLLEHNANVSVLDKEYVSPLELAAARGYEDLVKVLLKYNAYPKMESGDYLALHMCALYGHAGVADILLEHDPTQINISSYTDEFTALHFAALAGHIEVVNVLLKYRCNINCTDNDNFTPLHYSSLHGRKEVVMLLLQHKADINIVCFPARSTALHMAASHGHEEIVELLLRNDAKINAKDSSGKTALHLAAGYGHTAVLNVLLTHRAEVDCETNESATPLHFAAENDYTEIVILLIKAGANVDAQNRNLFAPLHFAAQNGYEGTANILIENNANVNINMLNEVTALHTSAKNGRFNVVKLLLESKKCNINATTISKCTALHFAVVNSHEDIVELLLNYKADINVTLTNNSTVMHYACQIGNVNIVKLLLQHHADISKATEEQKATPLHMAAQHGHDKVVCLLLDYDAKIIDATTRQEATALHLAVEVGHLAVVKVILQFNVDVDAVCEDQFTPLHLAAQQGYTDIAKLLIEHKCNINAVLISQHTPLHLATQNGHRRLVEVLIENQAIVDATDDELITPLHLAAQYGYDIIASILILHKANVNAYSTTGYTPLHVAALGGHEQAAAILLTHGADPNAMKTDDLTTPLHYAAENGHERIVDLLCSNGANVDASKSGKLSRPLHLATEKGFLEIVKILIKNKANVNALRNRDTPLYSTPNMLLRNDMHYIMKETALSIAIQNKREDIREYLLQNGAINGFEYQNHGN